MGLAKTAASAVNLLIEIGYFPVHVNLDLLKYNVRTEHSEEVVSAAESILEDTYDPDEVHFLPVRLFYVKFKNSLSYQIISFYIS